MGYAGKFRPKVVSSSYRSNQKDKDFTLKPFCILKDHRNTL